MSRRHPLAYGWSTAAPALLPIALVLASLVVPARPAGAQPVHAAGRSPAAPPAADTLHLSLEQAVARALGSGTRMQAARAGVGVADGRVREALSQALPQVTGTVSYNRKFDSIFSGVSTGDSSGLGEIFANSPFGAVHGWTLDLTASQLVWSGGRVGAALAGAKAVRSSATLERDQAGADVALAVEDAYWNVLYAREVEVIARHGLELAREHLHQVELYRVLGSRSEYDLLQAQVDAANQEPVVVAARSAAELAMLSLKQALNLPLDRPLVLDTPLAFGDAQVPVPSESPADAAARPAVQGAEAAVQARRAALRYERSGRWPELRASATMSHQAFPADGTPVRDQFHRSVDATLKLEWPLFQGFRTFSSVQRASNELRQAEVQRDETRQAAEVELAQARLGVDETLATLAARRGTARLAERAQHLADVRWRNGLGTQLEVSDARLRLQSAQVNEVLAVKQYRLSLARLDRAAGRAVPTTPRAIDEISFDTGSQTRPFPDPPRSPQSHEER